MIRMGRIIRIIMTIARRARPVGSSGGDECCFPRCRPMRASAPMSTAHWLGVVVLRSDADAEV